MINQEKNIILIQGKNQILASRNLYNLSFKKNLDLSAYIIEHFLRYIFGNLTDFLKIMEIFENLFSHLYIEY